MSLDAMMLPTPDYDGLIRQCREHGFVRGLRLAMHIARERGQKQISDAIFDVMMGDTGAMASMEFDEACAAIAQRERETAVASPRSEQ